MKSVIYLNKEKLHTSDHEETFIAPFTLSIDDRALSYHELSFRMSAALRNHNRFLRYQNWDEMTILYTKY
jgi:hypothetical protein